MSSGHFAERLDGGRVLSVRQDSLSRVSPPAVWAAQSLHQFGHWDELGLPVEIATKPVGSDIPMTVRNWLRIVLHIHKLAAVSRVVRDNAVNAAKLIATSKVDLLLPFGRDPFGVFDHSAIHIREPQRAIRPRPDHGWPKPIVSRCQELRVLLVCCSLPCECCAAGPHHQPRDQVVHGLSGKCVAVEVVTKQFVAIDHRAARGSKSIHVFEVVVAWQRAADGEYRRGAGHDRNFMASRFDRGVRISSQIVVGQRVMPHGVRVVAAEPVAPIVSVTSELCLPGLRIHECPIRTYTKIAPADLRLLACSIPSEDC